MSKINDEFMEAYKRIDQFCKDALMTDKGITSYIEEMRVKSDGYRFVPGWNESLNCLVKYRHIRNNYSHEVGSSYSDICEWDDIFWLREFYDSLIHVQDPLSIYKKAKDQLSSKQTLNTNKTINNTEDFVELDEPKMNRKKSRIPLVIGIVLFFVILLALAALALGIAFIVLI